MDFMAKRFSTELKMITPSAALKNFPKQHEDERAWGASEKLGQR